MGKEKRVTLMECPDDLCAMIDLAKIADVALLTVDASFGFEMSTFEFLSVMQTHGFPKVAGVLTRLDTMKTNKSLGKIKKALKHRFWDDVYQGAKVFNMSGVMRSGKYPKNDTRQLGLFLQRQKMRPLTWRNRHSYALCDRVDRAADGAVDCYGWLRGARHNAAATVHVPGLGDFEPLEVEALDDPLPSFQELKDKGEALRRKKAETLLYAPLASYGGVSRVGEELAIDPPPKDDKPPDSVGLQMLRELQHAHGALDRRVDSLQFRLFDDDDDEPTPHRVSEPVVEEPPPVVVEEEAPPPQEEEDSDDEVFFARKGTRTLKKGSAAKEPADDADDADAACPLDLGDGELILERVKHRFVERGGGSYDDEVMEEREEEEAAAAATEEDEQTRARRVNAAKKAAAAAEEEDEEGEESKGFAEKRRLEALVAKEEEELGEAGAEVAGLGNGQYVRFRLGPVPAGLWSHWDARRPFVVCGLLEHEKDEATTTVTARLRRHRWHPKILKARDPIIFSVGWRRFQAAPLFSMRDRAETRHRFLKYTPEHMHCDATFVAPAVAPNSPLIGFHTLRPDAGRFRACCVGLVTAVGAVSRVVKKLKLQGFPYKVERNTAFVDGMFSTALEAAKFEGAHLKTVSGIRGAVKKAVVDDKETGPGRRHKPGAFRATFEDKILPSDIVVCRLWVPVEPPAFCAPIRSLLAPADRLEGLAPMRTVAEVRRDEKIPMPVNLDSVYGATEIVRGPRKFAPHLLPKTLVDRLPFASKPKNLRPKGSSAAKGYLATRDKFFAPPKAKEDRAATKLLQALSTIRNDRQRARREARHARTKAHAADVQKRVDAAMPKRKAEAKRKYKLMGQQQARKRAKFASGEQQ